MPQEHHVLRCFSCETFQVHIVKKSKKWECKICGAKQSVKRNYGKGSGQDCRNQVMKLNELQVLRGNSSALMEGDEIFEETFGGEYKDKELRQEKSYKSKWTEYLDENSAGGASESEDTTDCLSEIVSTKKRRVKKLPKNGQYSVKRICRSFKTSDEPSSKVCDELNPSFPAVDDEAFESSEKKNLCQIKTEKNNCDPTNTKSVSKLSKYAKYLDDNEDNNDATQVNKSSNIFNSDLDDLDNVLNF